MGRALSLHNTREKSKEGKSPIDEESIVPNYMNKIA